MEKTIFGRIKSGDDKAFELLYRQYFVRHWPKPKFYIMNLLKTRTKASLLFGLIILLFSPNLFGQQIVRDKFKDLNLSVDERVNDLVSKMTLSEKIAQLSHLAPEIKRLGVVEYGPVLDNPLKFDGHEFIENVEEYREKKPWKNIEYWKEGDCFDGGYWNESLHGIARSGLATVFPQSIGLGSTWNPDLIYQIATAISDEARVHHNVYGKKLTYWSPTINMLRDPRWGRIEEGYSEDPFLQSQMGVAYVKGMQGSDPNYLKTVATVKHFIANNSEVNRHDGSSDISERQLNEYYFPAFKAAVTEGNVQSVMGAYNKLNGVPACANSWLLTDVLRNEWGFKGFVVSDCGAISDLVHTHKYETDPEKAVAMAVKAGCDMECETCETEQLLYDKYLPGAAEKGYISEAEIDIAVKRIFRIRFLLGEFDDENLNPYNNIPESKLDSKEHRELALTAARESIVLLKNENNILPLDASKIGSIALIGPYADKVEFGGYSGTASYKITPLDGISEKISFSKIIFTEGCHPAAAYQGSMERAIEAAKNSEIAIVVLGTSLELADEGNDRKTLGLPIAQQELLKAVQKANPNTVLVLMNGMPLSLNWAKENVSTIVEAWYPGQSGGLAIADVLFGDYNPAGRLPVTFYSNVNQLPDITDYDITKGRTYWYFDGDVSFPFGHGLSYTTFDYKLITAKSKLNLRKEKEFTVKLSIDNVGDYSGDEVVQLYIKDSESKFIQPKLKLRKFKRINIAKGETKTIEFVLDKSDFSFWNPKSKKWTVEKGDFEILVGSSSEDVRIVHLVNVR